MKILLGSLLAFCAGAVLGWDWSEESKVDVEKAVVLSDRILVNKEVEVVDPAWGSWAGRISTASGENLQGLLAELETSGMKGNAKLKRLICRRWVELDPGAGLVALGGEVKMRAAFFAEWLTKDFEGAMASMKGDAARMRKLVLGELLAGEDFEVTLDFLGRTGNFETDWGVKANEEWLRLLGARTDEMEEIVLEVLEREGRGVRSATGQLLIKLGRVKFEAQSDLALEWAEGFQEEGRRYVMEGMMTAWVKDDPFAVAAKFDEWRGGENLGGMALAKAVAEVVSVSYREDPEKAEAIVEALPPGGVRQQVASALIRKELGPNSVKAFERARSEEAAGMTMDNQLWLSVGRSLGRNKPEETRRIFAESEEELNRAFRTYAMEAAFWKEPEETKKWAEEMEGERREELIHLVYCAWHLREQKEAKAWRESLRE